MTNLFAPTAGGRIRISPTGTGEYTVKTLPLGDPLEGASDAEREYYLTHYQGVPLVELLRRLRKAEWNEAYLREENERLKEQARHLPPLHLIKETDARHKRIRALLDRPGRISRADLIDALGTPTV
jgi:hypothetical protein